MSEIKIKISSRIEKMEESATLAMSRKSRELEEKGIKIIKLNIGEPDFYTPTYIKVGAVDAIANNFTYYPPVEGYKSFREAISKKLKDKNGLDFKPEQIVVSTGAKHSIMNVILSIIDPGDEVIIPAPYWVSYPEMIKFADGEVVEIKTNIEDNFKFTPEQLEKAITTKTKAIIYSSPSNPTGSLYTKEELKAIADVLAKYPNIIVISDEIYEHINFTGKPHESIAQFENMKDRVVGNKRRIKRLCNDRLANRLSCSSNRNCKSSDKTARTIYFGSMFYCTKSFRNSNIGIRNNKNRSRQNARNL